MMRCARGGTRGGEFFLLFGVANGAMKNRIALLDWKNVHHLGKQIVGIKTNHLVTYTPGNIDTKEYPLPETLLGYEQIHFTASGCFVLKNGSIYKYDWKK